MSSTTRAPSDAPAPRGRRARGAPRRRTLPGLLALALGAFAPATARAQPRDGLASAGGGETLAALLEGAARHNVDGRIALEQAAKASADLRAAWAALLPSLTVQGTWTHNQYEVTFKTGPATTLTIQPLDQLDALVRVELPLVDAARWVRVAAAREGERSAAARAEAARELVRRQVISTWYGYAAALAVSASARRSAAVAEEQAKLVEIRAEAGAGTELDRLRARAEVQRTRQVIADMGALVGTTRRLLETLTGLTPPEAVPLPTDDVRPERPAEELEARAARLPQVVAAERDAAAARELALGSRLALVPVVSAQFTERLSNATGFSGKSATYLAGASALWRVDVPTFWSMRAQSSAAQVAALAVERARAAARDQIHNDWLKLESARAKVDSAKAQASAAARAAQVARDRFAVGAATQVEVIQAERDLFGAEVGEISARTELASARLVLRQSAGLPLEGDEAPGSHATAPAAPASP